MYLLKLLLENLIVTNKVRKLERRSEKMNYAKKKLRKEDIILLQLRMAIIELSNELADTSNKQNYKIKVQKILSFEQDLVTVAQLDKKVRFEVREKEAPHNIPHFHITIKNGGDGSYKISDLTPIETTIPRKTEKKLLIWAEKNRQILVDTWNEFHGYRVMVE